MIGRKALGRSRVPQPVRDVYQWVNRSQGRLDASRRVLPNFFVAGTQRGGTTSLFIYLLRHELVFGPRRAKGVHYFDTSYHRSVDWYRAQFPRQTTMDRLRQEHGVPPAVGEGAPYYMYNPTIAPRIAALAPEARVIMVLREPLERALSHHNHECTRGFEHLRAAEAFDAEPERLAGELARLEADEQYVSHNDIHFSYISRSRYADQVAQYFDLFGRNQVLVLDSARLNEDPAATVREATDFLGLPALEQQDYPRYNQRAHDPVSPEMRERFGPLFEESNAKLAALVPGRLSWLEPGRNRDDLSEVR